MAEYRGSEEHIKVCSNLDTDSVYGYKVEKGNKHKRGRRAEEDADNGIEKREDKSDLIVDVIARCRQEITLPKKNL